MHSSRMHTTLSSSCLLGGVCLSACWGTHPLGVGLETPLVWAWRSPRPDPSTPPGCEPGDPLARPLNFPPRCELGDPPGQTPQLPSWVLAWRPPRRDPSTASRFGPGDLQDMLGYHPPVNRMTDRHV